MAVSLRSAETRAVPAEHLPRQHFGVERGELGADAGVHEAVASALHEVVNGHDHRVVASFSFSDW